MAAPLSYLVNVLVTALLHQRTEATISVVDADRILVAYQHGFDNCKDVTDFTTDASKAAADEACGQAFEALDLLNRNTCKNWQEAGCRLTAGQKKRQCTCKIPSQVDSSNRNDIVKPFRECAATLSDYLERTREESTPTPGFQQRRSEYDEALQDAQKWRDYFNHNGGSGSSSGAFAFPAGEAGSSRGVKRPRDAVSGSLRAGAAQIDPLRPYQCPECPKNYISPGNLAQHMILHTTEETKCRFCNYYLSTRSALDTHVKIHHSGSDKAPRARGPQPRNKRAKDRIIKGQGDAAFICKECGKSYTYASNLRDHELSHTTLDTYCFKCKRNLASKQSYKSHMQKRHPEDALAAEAVERKLYEEENPEKCGQCDKRFKTPKSLIQHKYFHVGKTKCDECDAVFQQRATLYNHKARAHKKPKDTDSSPPK